MEWWSFRTGFTLLKWGSYVGIAAILAAVAAAVVTRPGSHRSGFVPALVALLVAVPVVLLPWSWKRTAGSVPAIHDITTDTRNPPTFAAIVPLRADAPNSIVYEGESVAEQQRAAYPDVQPAMLAMPVDEAFRRALEAAEEMGWEIVDVSREDGRIEATDRTFWFGFRDDVVIRVVPASGISRVDVRSVSRVGGSDVGANAKRIRGYLKLLKAEA